MRVRFAADTDCGLKKAVNQDSLSVQVVMTPIGRAAFVVLCDGMGGLQSGEIASASVVMAYVNWLKTEFVHLCTEPFDDVELKRQWKTVLDTCSQRIHAFGDEQHIRLGSTAVVCLFLENKTYVMNVGDSRLYLLTNTATILTRDHSIVWQEVERGNLTPEQAKHHPKRNILTQSVGGAYIPEPDFYVYDSNYSGTYLFCSDGFHHELTDSELIYELSRFQIRDEVTMRSKARQLIDLVMSRGEKDNISVVLLCMDDDRIAEGAVDYNDTF